MINKGFGHKEEELLDNLWADCLKKQGVAKFCVRSGSMTPLIEVNDKVTVKKTENPEKLRLGEIILFSLDGYRVIHRIIGKTLIKRELYFRQKGDAVMDSGIISGDQILGKAVMVEKPEKVIYLERFSTKIASYILGILFALTDALTRGGRKIKESFSNTEVSSKNIFVKAAKSLLKTPLLISARFYRLKKRRSTPR